MDSRARSKVSEQMDEAKSGLGYRVVSFAMKQNARGSTAWRKEQVAFGHGRAHPVRVSGDLRGGVSWKESAFVAVDLKTDYFKGQTIWTGVKIHFQIAVALVIYLLCVVSW